MSKRQSLVIVESPAKAKTIKKYLGTGYQVLASYGHVRDLLPKEGAVDPAHDFAMKYHLIEKNKKHVDAILSALEKCDNLILATDPDREGEAISYQLVEYLKEQGALDGKTFERVAFFEITKAAILEAMKNPRDISMDLVNAQQARRALDYLVGFKLSPLLWRKIRPGLSAGRVQSPALCMIVEREKEIEAFQSREYWTILADCKKQKDGFKAKLALYDGEKVKQFTFESAQQVDAAVERIQKAAASVLEVAQVQVKQRQRHPQAPFTTSTLQQEASRKLGFGAQRTMRIAQQLYEGVDIGDETVGLITYMRTDSVNISATAIEEAREVILEKYGPTYLPESPRLYKTRSKNAQEAHEAVRPTALGRTPDQLAKKLSADQLKLYDLIYKRTLACQMNSALFEQLSADLACADEGVLFRATGSVLVFAGYLKCYEEGKDEDAKEEIEDQLPALKKGDKIDLKKVYGDQHFTEPPPRYTEATLVKTLEEHGIGRPSTYAAILSTLQQREYVVLETKRFMPTDVGRVVSKFLTQYFTQYVDYGFTSQLEDELDAVARGEQAWKPLLHTFWEPFHRLLEETLENVQRKDVVQEAMDEACPDCGKPLSSRLGKRGRFVGCTGYPECSYTRSLGEDKDTPVAPPLDRNCPDCEAPLLIRVGKYGKFIGCSAYPKCKHIEPLEKPQDTNVTCPVCKAGQMVSKKSRYGKIFFACGEYPKCQYAVWYKPIAQECPQCKWPITIEKVTKRRGQERECPQKECDFREAWSPEQQ